MTPTSETVTHLLRHSAGERAMGKQFEDEDYSKKGNGVLRATLNEGKR